MRGELLFVSVLAILWVGGCGDNTPIPANDGDTAGQRETIEKYNAWYEEQLKAGDKQILKATEQASRFDVLLDKWEEQARRFDAILDRWEQMLPERESDSAPGYGSSG